MLMPLKRRLLEYTGGLHLADNLTMVCVRWSREMNHHS